MTFKTDAAVVGAGLAGLAAAGVLADAGAKVTLLDENHQTGGQYLRRLPPGWRTPDPGRTDSLKKKGLDLIRRIEAGPVEILNGAAVLGIFSGNRLVIQTRRGELTELKARVIILATGARERFLPFPGWTLPGVISTGAAQIMMKSRGVLPEGPTVVAGCGPLPLVAAAEIIKNKGRVRVFLDETAPAIHIRNIRRIMAVPDKIAQGLAAAARLVLAGTSIKTGAAVIEARGRSALEEVVIARMDGQGRIIPDTTETIKTRSLAIGHGFTANIELAGQAGCRLDYAPDKGGWVVRVDESFLTSQPGIYAAGEIIGIGGAEKSYLEGRLAGWSAARKMVLAGFSEYLKSTVPLQEKLKACHSFGLYLNALSRPAPARLAGLPDETMICRCENITLGRVRQAVSEGFESAAALKKATRCQMGICQGRTCGPIIEDIVRETGLPRTGEPHPPSHRFPVKATPLNALLQMSTNDSNIDQ